MSEAHHDIAAMSTVLAVGAFFITESIPLSREDSASYISLFPITWELAAFNVK
jgi:hypothetical protein